MRIFLSYATEQKAVAEPIAFSLRGRGHHVFLDKDDLPPGQTYDDQIQKAVEQSDVMIFLVSPASVAKGRYTRTEIEFARAAWRHPANRILPVVIEPTPIADTPSFLKGVTLLEPHGNVTAEVAAAVERMRSTNVAVVTAAKGAAIAAGFVLATLIWNNISFRMNFGSGDAWLPLSGVPFCAIIWLLAGRRDILTLGPLITVAATSYMLVLALGQLGPQHIFETVDWTLIPSASDTATTEGETSDQADVDAVAALRTAAVDKIHRMNSRAKMLNFSADFTFWGVVSLLGVFVGATWATPEINSPARWVISMIVGSIAIWIAAMANWMLFYEEGFLGELGPAFATTYSWFPIAGAILAYWIGRGRPA